MLLTVDRFSRIQLSRRRYPLLKAVAGLLRPISGNIFFAGENITPLPAHLRAQKGIALVPEGRRLFAGMTV
jgi:branched-chain amino acid transport system ATP-binding protein